MSDQGQTQRPGRGSEPAVVVYHGEEPLDGTPIEPEEQLAEVVQPVPPVVTVGSGHMREDVPLTPEQKALASRLPTHIAHQTSAGELAASVLQRCQNCVHYDHEGWLRALKRIEASGDRAKLEDLNRMRGEIGANLNVEIADKHGDGSGGVDLEHALHSIGVCLAITEAHNDLTLVFPFNPCSFPDFFRPRPELEARRAAANGYDWIMHRAQGRK